MLAGGRNTPTSEHASTRPPKALTRQSGISSGCRMGHAWQ
jgi:hypothetical protein